MATAVLSGMIALSMGCTGSVSPGETGSGAKGGGTGNSSGSGSSQGSGATQGSGGSGGTTVGGSGAAVGSGGSGSGGATGPVSQGGVMLRRLTRAEYLVSVQALLGPLTTQLAPPDDDLSVAGFVSVGASTLPVTDTAETAYEQAIRDATAEVFGDTQRWQKLVGCAPKADLSDACVTTYIKTFGRSAFRRDLTTDEVTQWVGVAKNAATLAGTAAQALATVTSGLLQSPYFLYRVETNKLDSSNGRLKYDGLSMANRLSYLLTGGPPSADLLTSATSGKLDTADGVGTAAAPLLTSTGLADRVTAFFSEYAQGPQVLQISKSKTTFPSFNDALQNSMFQGLQLFLKNIVAAANADVRSFYDSDQTFVDANLATLYGVKAPASGFGQVKLDSSTGRAGILGQAAVLAGQSESDRTSPTRRGLFVFQSLYCNPPPVVPMDVDTTVPPIDSAHPQTRRQQLEAHRMDPKCAGCHGLFDPFGYASEHFDALGQYRETENGLAIDTTGKIGGNGASFDGVAQLGTVLRQDPKVITCLLRNLYRNANGRAEDGQDQDQIKGLVTSLAARNYVWRDFLADFVVSDAFRSAPALPVTTGSP
ncbi:MAG: DUF1588 domain-containing protein [Myxococcales bacterium]